MSQVFMMVDEASQVYPCSLITQGQHIEKHPHLWVTEVSIRFPITANFTVDTHKAMVTWLKDAADTWLLRSSIDNSFYCAVNM